MDYYNVTIICPQKHELPNSSEDDGEGGTMGSNTSSVGSSKSNTSTSSIMDLFVPPGGDGREGGNDDEGGKPPAAPATPKTVDLAKLLLSTLRGLQTDDVLPEGKTFSYQLVPSETPMCHVSTPVHEAQLSVVLERLEAIGIGTKVGSLSVVRCAFTRIPPPTAAAEKAGAADVASATALLKARKEWITAASRLRVSQVAQQVSLGASFSFDFCSLLLIASILAGVGLINDNTVVIVASMLVSPIMGPVLGLSFGSVIRDYKLVRKGMWTEIVALTLCCLLGVILGVICVLGGLLTETWPTSEMSSRGDVAGLVTGIVIAIPSGMGVALSTLGNNTSSLVGVAISASLLPPAVNAGLCWSVAFILSLHKGYDFDGSQDWSIDDWVSCGTISFLLTVVNILCIWASGVLMFRLKEVAPVKDKNTFWSRDVKAARQQPVAAGADAKVLKEGLKAALKMQKKGRRRDMNTFKPKPGQKVKFGGLAQGGGAGAPSVGNAFENAMTLNTNSMIGEGNLLDLFKRSKDLAPENMEERSAGEGEDEDDHDSFRGDKVKFFGMENMATLLFQDIEAEDADEDLGDIMRSLFDLAEEGTTVDHLAVQKSIRHLG
ncbi:hypothetical protein TrST_g8887 [Triparma strigata]|uniref:DUF389 domain-containing protein n=1 Tax=Triparma strigata TaxID=1606541 RepID=A0A9W7F152_9STRA|nr:hypothetical protein TrST_g8887 [Triparma strigata]